MNLKFYKSFSWSTVATLSTVGASFFFNKIFSIFYGPAGIALLSHLQNILAILLTIPQDGINKGVIKYLSGKSIIDNEGANYNTAAIWLHLITFIISLPLLYLLLYSPRLPVFLRTNLFFFIVVISFLFKTLILYLLTLFLTKQQISIYSYITIFNNIAAVVLVYLGSTQNIFLASSLLFVGPCIGLLFLLSKVKLVFTANTISFPEKGKMRNLMEFIAIALSILIFGKLVDYFVRAFIIEKYSADSAGLWQAAVRLSDGYTTVFSGVLGISFYPQLAGLINRNKSIRSFFYTSCLKYLSFVFLGLIIIVLFKEFFILLLFNKSFLDAIPFLNLQIAGDLLKFPSWIVVYIILAEGKTRQYIYLQLFSSVLYIGLIYYCTQYMALIGIGYAHIFRFAIYLLVVIVLCRKKIF